MCIRRFEQKTQFWIQPIKLVLKKILSHGLIKRFYDNELFKLLKELS